MQIQNSQTSTDNINISPKQEKNVLQVWGSRKPSILHGPRKLHFECPIKSLRKHHTTKIYIQVQ